MIRYQNELNSQFKKSIESCIETDADVFFMDNKRWVTFEFTEKMKYYFQCYEKKESVSEFADEIFDNFKRRRLDLNVQHNVSSEEFNKILNENLQEFK
jgi:predicted transcriptional regulator